MAGLGLGKALTSVSEEALKGCGRTTMLNYLTATEVVLGIGLLVLIIPFGLVGVGLAISLTGLAVGAQCVWLARPVVGVDFRDLRRAIAPPVVAGAAAIAVTAWLEHGLLHADTRPVLVAIGALLLDAVVFLTVYIAVAAAVSPAIARAVRGSVHRTMRRMRRR
jgi:Polysaccharide biosynthesis C-terminal domain